MSFAFTPENRSRAHRAMGKYPKGREQSAVLALLDLAQRQNDEGHYVTKAAMETIAKMLGMPLIRVMEVASFFTMINLAPVGRYHIQLCGTTPCMLRGSEDLKAMLKDSYGLEPGETRGLFTLTEVECLGSCCNAPMVQINDDYFEDLTPASLRAVLEALEAGRPVRVGSQTGRQGSAPVASGER